MNQQTLKSLLHYDPGTGLFVWLASRSGVKKGDVAGTLLSGRYCNIGINGKIYRAQRLACLYMTGAFPEQMMDHINGNKMDNRWVNLRNSSHSQNSMNKGKGCRNTSGYKGVHFIKRDGRWGAKIKLNGKAKWLGTFDCPKEAHNAYVEASKLLHGEFSNIG